MSVQDHNAPPKKRILVADDEPHIRRILATFLEASGFDVVEVMDGAAALEELQASTHYDLALLDIMMPEHTGLEVLGFVRGLSHRKGLPVVILTAKGQDADRQAAFRLGADDFLTKPFSPKKLLARIHGLIGNS
ncbi:MAG: response regulator transcription factor [Gemmatimonadetes bacterium]|nr:response regulator transcription factor [Gemmatimonadota bacterium]NNM06443.1 response regulator transcription factor [Gemmatimonadota bacterium]